MEEIGSGRSNPHPTAFDYWPGLPRATGGGVLAGVEPVRAPGASLAFAGPLFLAEKGACATFDCGKAENLL